MQRIDLFFSPISLSFFLQQRPVLSLNPSRTVALIYYSNLVKSGKHFPFSLCHVVQAPCQPSRTLGTDRMEAARQSPVRPWLKREVGPASLSSGRSVAAALLRMSAGWCVTWFQETLVSSTQLLTCLWLSRVTFSPKRRNNSSDWDQTFHIHLRPSDKEPRWGVCWVDES